MISLSPSFLTSITDNQDLYWVYFNMLSQPVVWLCMISATVASLIPDIISRTIENIFERNKVNKLGKNDQERQISQKDMIH